ncbi:hypothetical protein D3C87_1053920 [compost metagenome]
MLVKGEHQEDEEHQEDGDAEDEPGERANPALELGRGRRAFEGSGHLAHLGGVADPDGDRPSRPADHRAARKDAVSRFVQPDVPAQILGFFFGRERLPRERGLIDVEVLGTQETPIGRNDIPCRKQKDVPRHDLGKRDRDERAVAKDPGARGDQTLQGFGGPLGPEGLYEVE